MTDDLNKELPEIPAENPIEPAAETPAEMPAPAPETDFVISKQEAEHCRHRLEKRWYRRLIELNFLLVFGVLALVCFNWSKYQTMADELIDHTMTSITEGKDYEDEEGRDYDAYIQDFVSEIPIELKALGYGFVMMIALYIVLYMQLASVKAASVKITPNNFPEVYDLVQTYGRRLGMKKIPEVYVMQQSGVLNAFSAFIPHRQYILINAEIFEVAYREHHDMDTLGFIIAHEMAHIYYGHATMHYNVPIWFVMNFPLFGAIASRAREYSCDRLAQHLTRTDGLDSMFMLMMDRHIYHMVDKQDYLNTTANEGGFFLWLTNLLATHPIMPKRIRALAQMEGSGELY